MFFDEHVREYRRWRYYNCRVQSGNYMWDPDDPCLTLSYLSEV